jgi:hypothetical protein
MPSPKLSKKHGKSRCVSKNTLTKNRLKEGLPLTEAQKRHEAQLQYDQMIAAMKKANEEKIKEEAKTTEVQAPVIEEARIIGI